MGKKIAEPDQFGLNQLCDFLKVKINHGVRNCQTCRFGLGYSLEEILQFQPNPMTTTSNTKPQFFLKSIYP